MSTAASSGVSHIVITLHGIRTFGDWQGRLRSIVQRVRSDVMVLNYAYGYFSAPAFLLPFFRWIEVRRFRADFADIAKRNPQARIDIVAHSFGTHVFTHAFKGMRSSVRPRIHTVILAGSVLSSRFRWQPFLSSGQIRRVINDCGIRDGVLLLSYLFPPFTGMAGRLGFVGLQGPQFINRYFGGVNTENGVSHHEEGGHSHYFESRGSPDDAFMTKWWLPLIVGDDAPREHDTRKAPTAVSGLWRFLLQNSAPLKAPLYAFLAYLLVSPIYEQSVDQRRRGDGTLLMRHLNDLLRASPHESATVARLSVEAFGRYPSADTAGALVSAWRLLPPRTGRVDSALEVSAIALARGGVVVGSEAGDIRRWNSELQKLQWEAAHEGRIERLVPLGDHLMSVSALTRYGGSAEHRPDQAVRLWSPQRAAPATESLGEFLAVAVSSDAGAAAVGGARGVVIADAEHGLSRIQASPTAVAVAFHPDGKRLYVAHSQGAVSEVTLDTFQASPVLTETRGISRMALIGGSRDPKYVILASGNQINLWGQFGPMERGAGWQRDSSARTGGTIYDLIASPSRDIVALVVMPDAVELWSITTIAHLGDPSEPHTLLARVGAIHHKSLITGVQFSNDSKYILTSSLDGTVRLSAVPSGREVARFGAREGVTAIDWDRTYGGLVAAASEKGIIDFWRARTPAEDCRVGTDLLANANKLSVAVNQAGFVAGTTVRWYRVGDAVTLYRCTTKGPANLPGFPSGRFTDVDGTTPGMIAATGATGTVIVHIVDGQIRAARTDPRPGRFVRISPGGSEALVGGEHQIHTIKLSAAGAPAHGRSIPPSGRLVGLSARAAVVRFEDRCEVHPATGRGGAVCRLPACAESTAIGPGALVAFADADASQVSLWDWERCTRKGSFEVRDSISSLSVSASGRWLAVGVGDLLDSGSQYYGVRIFDTTSGNETITAPTDRPPLSVEFDSDEKWLVTAGGPVQSVPVDLVGLRRDLCAATEHVAKESEEHRRSAVQSTDDLDVCHDPDLLYTSRRGLVADALRGIRSLLRGAWPP